MGTRMAVIDAHGAVTNVIVADPSADFDPGEGLELVALTEGSPVCPGWTRSGQDWHAPATVTPPPTPEQLQSQIDELTDLVLDQAGS